MTTVKQIVENYLKEKGYDGLCTDECGCEIADLCPCGFDAVLDCVPGYKVPCTCGEGCKWHMATEKAGCNDSAS